MRQGFDTSNPGTQAVPGFDVAGGYLGGATPHVWTLKQWDAQPCRWRSLFWVYDGAADPRASASQAISNARALGCPAGVRIWLDMETHVDPAWVNVFADAIHTQGHTTGCYGSTSTLFRNPVRSGYFPADPTGVSHLYEHPHTLATQWGQQAMPATGLKIDLDVYADGVPLWDTRPAPVQIRPQWATDAIADLTCIATDALTVRTILQINT
jgi:Domain of unknown function (DUF1906)